MRERWKQWKQWQQRKQKLNRKQRNRNLWTIGFEVKYCNGHNFRDHIMELLSFDDHKSKCNAAHLSLTASTCKFSHWISIPGSTTGISVRRKSCLARSASTDNVRSRLSGIFPVLCAYIIQKRREGSRFRVLSSLLLIWVIYLQFGIEEARPFTVLCFSTSDEFIGLGGCIYVGDFGLEPTSLGATSHSNLQVSSPLPIFKNPRAQQSLFNTLSPSCNNTPCQMFESLPRKNDSPSRWTYFSQSYFFLILNG